MTLKQAASKMKTSEATKKKTENFKGQKCKNNISKNEKCREIEKESKRDKE